jgi:hypothetical protein
VWTGLLFRFGVRFLSDSLEFRDIWLYGRITLWGCIAFHPQSSQFVSKGGKVLQMPVQTGVSSGARDRQTVSLSKQRINRNKLWTFPLSNFSDRLLTSYFYHLHIVPALCSEIPSIHALQSKWEMSQRPNDPTSLEVEYLSFELVWNFRGIVWFCNLTFLTKCPHAEVRRINYVLFWYFRCNLEFLLMKIHPKKRERGLIYGLAKH